jgi:hypothetical protein
MGIGENTNKNITVLNVYGDFFMKATVVYTNVTLQGMFILCTVMLYILSIVFNESHYH